VRTRADGDTTHAFDEKLEERILQFFVNSKLPIRFSSEERADVDLVGSPELLALVDPLDGSDMAARGYPLCSISVSLVDMATMTPVISRIVEVFTGLQYAAHQNVALRNGVPMRPSGVESADEAFIVSYFASHSRMAKARERASVWSHCKLVMNYGGLLDIAKVGAGQCDAMIEVLNGMVAREYIAGVHIAQAAGATASTLDGRAIPLPLPLERDARSTFVVAATPQLHEELLGLFG
jgi:fructose-1,6-bisphosphatase/inositol monophosphatase family enzyme